MRLVLFTGKGGVGKTTMAAATAVAVAAHGHKVLVVSTDHAHSLADALAVPLGADPVEVATGVSAMQVDAQAGFEQSWPTLQGYLLRLLGRAGIGSLAAEELTVLPGAQEILALLAVRDQAASGRYDAVLVDCPPTAQTLRLLALPRVLQWYLERGMPTHRRVVRGLGPWLGGASLPGDALVDAVSRLHAELLGVQAVLEGATTTVRLVLTPEAMALAEARRTATSLSLYGYRLDSVVVNRVIPGGADPWRAGWARAHAACLAEVEASFPDLSIRTAAYRPAEPLGPAALAEIAAGLYGGDDPLVVPPAVDPVQLRRVPDDQGERFELSIALPHAPRGAVGLARTAEELVLTVGGHRRLLALPGVLRRCLVSSADLADGWLVVVFRPDPALWPTP